MTSFKIKPYAKLLVGVKTYQIMCYNCVTQEWETFEDVFYSDQEINEKLDELNQESGLVTFIEL